MMCRRPALASACDNTADGPPRGVRSQPRILPSSRRFPSFPFPFPFFIFYLELVTSISSLGTSPGVALIRRVLSRLNEIAASKTLNHNLSLNSLLNSVGHLTWGPWGPALNQAARHLAYYFGHLPF